jgi:hypothetical protein
MAGASLFLHDAIKDAFLEGLIEARQRLTLGDGLAPETLIGPLISGPQRRKVRGFIETAEAEGAKVIYAGETPGGTGHFIGPTIVCDVKPKMQIAQQEVFGPVLAVQTFGDDERVWPKPSMTPSMAFQARSGPRICTAPTASPSASTAAGWGSISMPPSRPKPPLAATGSPVGAGESSAARG